MEFIHDYFIYLWLGMMVLVLTTFIVRGTRALKQFKDIDFSKAVYSDKSASGYSMKSFLTRKGGGSRVVHVIVVNDELIIKGSLMIAAVAKTSDMVHNEAQ